MLGQKTMTARGRFPFRKKSKPINTKAVVSPHYREI